MRRPPRPPKIAHPRRGLAPVELVLALPVWLLLASSMVLVGNLGAWKIRGHLAAREAAARSQWPRTTAGGANPREWSRPSAGMQSRSAIAPGAGDPLAAHTALRGPQIGPPGGGAVLGVDSAAMETQSTAVAGEAFLNEPPALWPRSGFRNRFGREYPVLDGRAGQWSPGAPRELRCERLWNLPVFD